MDLTGKTLREVEFREKLRGYHPDDVDDFLEEVAVAVDQLLARLGGESSPLSAPATPPIRELVEEDRVDATIRPSAPDAVSEETLRRTLVLAQRTADLAVSEAQETARALVDDAKQEAARMIAEAEAKVSSLSNEARSRTQAAVGDLEQRRAGLEREVAALQAWASQQRDKLREALSSELRTLDTWLASGSAPQTVRGSDPSATDAPGGPVITPGSDATGSSGSGGPGEAAGSAADDAPRTMAEPDGPGADSAGTESDVGSDIARGDAARGGPTASVEARVTSERTSGGHASRPAPFSAASGGGPVRSGGRATAVALIAEPRVATNPASGVLFDVMQDDVHDDLDDDMDDGDGAGPHVRHSLTVRDAVAAAAAQTDAEAETDSRSRLFRRR